MLEFKPIGSTVCELGEGPVYDDRNNALWYCDILGKTIHRYDLDGGGESSWAMPSVVGSLGLCESGKLIVALRDSVGLFDPASGSFDVIANIEADLAGTRLNDGKIGPDGAFWVGTMDDRGPKREPIGSLYRVDPSGTVEKKVEGLTVSNGLAFSPAGDRMYHADTRGTWIDRWDFDATTGAIGNRTRIAEPTEESGLPDGGATDADGNYWSAAITASRLNKYAPDGALLETVDLPVGAPTMPCFGGPNLTTLFVTSLRTGRAPELLERYPLTGITIMATGAVAGCPVGRFRDSG